MKSDKTGRCYIGYTSDLKKRFSYHNNGNNKSTRLGIPWHIVYTEQVEEKHDAWKREHQIKSYKGGDAFKKLILKNF